MDEYVQESNCFQGSEYDYTKDDLPMPIHLVEVDSILINNFSFNFINIAHAFGFRDELEEYLVGYK